MALTEKQLLLLDNLIFLDNIVDAKTVEKIVEEALADSSHGSWKTIMDDAECTA